MPASPFLHTLLSKIRIVHCINTGEVQTSIRKPNSCRVTGKLGKVGNVDTLAMLDRAEQ